VSTGRRRFIATLAAPVIAGAACGRTPRAPFEDPIVIVGAGLAGLRAADLIRAGGRQVIVLEARPGPGGRVRTLRAPFSDGLHGEAGAARIASVHGRVLRIAAEHRLGLMPFAPASGAPVIATKAGRWRLPDDLKNVSAAFKLTSGETGHAPGALLRRYVGEALADVKDPSAPSADALERWRPYDRVTWPAWLASRGASPGAVALMTLGGDSRELSALYVLRQMALLGGTNEFHRIEGGMERLVRVLANRLLDSVRYNAPVTRVDQSTDAVSVGYLQAGRGITVKASRVIFTNPFSTLRRVSIHPELPPAKARVIADVPYYPATRVVVQAKTRFWEADGLSGAARTDDPAEIWDAASDQTGAAGLLAATGSGNPRDAFDRAFPGSARRFDREASVSWGQEPWSLGAFAVFRPGQMTAFAPEIARPEGRLHFAGEHTSPWMGWMEGALESAERVAREVLA
jgi:monoamine oxidase